VTDARFRGRSALVTGASSGLGETFVRTLAAGGADVLLTALPEERARLEQIAAAISASYGVRTEIVPMDLSTPDGPGSLVAEAARLGFEPSMLVNSAGFGMVGRVADLPLERQLAMIRVNALALAVLTGTYLPRMVERGDGVIVNVASTAALTPLPYFATYSASKAFVLAFGEALWAEARAAGVRVVTVCTGPVETPFLERVGDLGDATGVKRQLRRRYLTPEAVVTKALAAVEADRPRVVLRLPGAHALHVATSALGVVVPRRWEMLASERLARWMFRVR
jgi:short-subunit dehydrogenase